jgi:hypothetical protein
MGPPPRFAEILDTLGQPKAPSTGSAVSDAFMHLGLIHPSHRFLFVTGVSFVGACAIRPTWMAERGAPAAKYVMGVPLLLGAVAATFF